MNIILHLKTKTTPRVSIYIRKNMTLIVEYLNRVYRRIIYDVELSLIWTHGDVVVASSYFNMLMTHGFIRRLNSNNR